MGGAGGTVTGGARGTVTGPPRHRGDGVLAERGKLAERTGVGTALAVLWDNQT